METWTSRELPVLRALVDQFETGTSLVPTPAGLAAAAGLSEADAEKALIALGGAEPPYFVGHKGWGDRYPLPGVVTERARRAVGQWPASDDAADVFLAALQGIADKEPDPEKRSRLKSIAGFFGDAGKDVLAKVIAEIAAKAAGMH